MRQIRTLGKRLLLTLLVLIFVLAAILFFRNRYRMYQYYSDPQSYRVVTATIDNIFYEKQFAVFHFTFDPTYTEFGSNEDFKISGNNYKIMMQNGFESAVKIGDSVTFVTAPGIFYDGYAPPIIAISCNSTEYLDQDVGRGNLLHSIWLLQ